MTSLQKLEKGLTILERAELHLYNRDGITSDYELKEFGYKTTVIPVGHSYSAIFDVLVPLQKECRRQILRERFGRNIDDAVARASLFLAVVLTGLLFLGIPLPAKAEQPSFCLTQFAGAQERSRLGQDENPEIVAASNGAELLPHDSSAPEIAITAFRPGRKSGFLTKRNVALITASAATLSLDALSTQRNFGQGLSEINPVLRHLQSRGGTSLYFAASLAAETGAMYFAHRRGWKRTQWLIPSAVVAVETYWVAKNFSLQRLPAAPPTILKAVAEFHF
jgi:hypothetical protein